VFRILIGSGTRKAEITYKKEEKKKVEKFHGLIASPVALKTSTEASKIYILHFNCKSFERLVRSGSGFIKNPGS